MLTIHSASHLDHSVTPEQLAWVLEQCKDRTGFFIETFELPEDLGTVPCGLYGPTMGDDPVPTQRQIATCGYCAPCSWYGGLLCNNPELSKGAVSRFRGNRKYRSRCLLDAPMRQVRQISVIAGPHDGLDCVLYTIFGGPVAPQEPGDPTCKDKAKSEEFWSTHALVYGKYDAFLYFWRTLGEFVGMTTSTA